MVVSLATFHLIVAYRIISSVGVKKNELCPLLMKSGLNFLCFSPTHTTRAHLHLECLDKELGSLLDNLFSQVQNYKMHIYLLYNFPDRTGWFFQNFNRFNWFFFTVLFFRLFFSSFLSLIDFLVFLPTPSLKCFLKILYFFI